jgi:hypothetical protein
MEFVIIPLLALAYRLRGNGWPFGTTSGRVVWCSACAVSSWAVFGPSWAVFAFAGGYIGMMLSHSKWYQFKRPGSWPMMIAICIMRAALILPLGLGGIILPFAVAGGLLGATAYWFGTKVSPEPLRVAEPLVGAVFGAMLLGVWLCTIG